MQVHAAETQTGYPRAFFRMALSKNRDSDSVSRSNICTIEAIEDDRECAEGQILRKRSRDNTAVTKARAEILRSRDSCAVIKPKAKS
jgi:hypothetical protein